MRCGVVQRDGGGWMVDGGITRYVMKSSSRDDQGIYNNHAQCSSTDGSSSRIMISSTSRKNRTTIGSHTRYMQAYLV